MKIYISSDMEGTAGVVDWDHVRPGTHDYEYYVELLTNEINAAIEGAIEAGADEFVVNDSHGRMANLRPGALAGKASYLSGRFKPRYMMEGLDDSFDGVFLISYHGSMSSSNSVLSHTYFPQAFAEVTLNGHVAGESGINALVAKACGVPVVLITGDATTAAEIKDFCPGIRSAVVKRSITRFAAESLHPDEANSRIREEARRSIEGVSSARPPDISLPATLGIRFHNTDHALLASRVKGVTRTSDLAAEIEEDNPLELFTTFITVVLLCRGLVE
jgi:D-amino peptidase